MHAQLPWEAASEQILERSKRGGEHINPLFKQFCEEGEQYFSKSATEGNNQQGSNMEKSKEDIKRKYENAIRDYAILKEACAKELHILDLNKVGVEKDMRQILRNTAKYVGLAMPKNWESLVKDPFTRSNEENKEEAPTQHDPRK